MLQMTKSPDSAPPVGGKWPEPRVLALQVDDIYRHAPTATGFSYLGALLVLGVLIQTGDTGRGTAWFLWATIVAALRVLVIVSYRRRLPDADAAPWARLMIAANFLAGLQWAALGTLLWVEAPVYRQLFTLMVITCYVGGSLPAYSSVRGAHEALSIPATIPVGVYLFFVQNGVHWLAGATALFFCFAIVYYAAKLNRQVEDRIRLQIERDSLLELTRLLNEKLAKENQELAHRAAMRSMSVESARERAGRLETLFENSPLPQFECDGQGRVVTCNLAAERLFGKSHQDMVGRPFATLLSGPYAESKALAGMHEAVSVEVEIAPRAGETAACTASFTPLPERPGRSAGFGVILSGVAVHA
jgi:PAS domain S-box-containing protein